jgi:hypothetical protein
MAFVPPAGEGAAPKRGLGAGAIIGIVVGVVVLVVLICGGVGLAVMLPAHGKARQTAREVVTMSQARMLAQGVAIYAMENQDAMPVGATWTSDLAPYLGGPQQAAEALDSTRIEGPTPDYIYVPPKPRTGETVAKLADIANPSSYIILHEDPTRLPTRYPTVIVALADGSVHMIGRDELAARLAEQAAAITKSGTEGQDDGTNDGVE